jgi:hypothetical protein
MSALSQWLAKQFTPASIIALLAVVITTGVYIKSSAESIGQLQDSYRELGLRVNDHCQEASVRWDALTRFGSDNAKVYMDHNDKRTALIEQRLSAVEEGFRQISVSLARIESKMEFVAEWAKQNGAVRKDVP